MADERPDLAGTTPTPHRRTTQVVTELEACLDRQPEDPARWLGRLRDRLPELAQTMRELFEEKESGQLYSELPGRRPRVATRLEDLKDEHPLMLTEMDKIIHAASGMGDAGRHELAELNARVQLLAARLRRHDAAENELMFEVYWLDLGAGD